MPNYPNPTPPTTVFQDAGRSVVHGTQVHLAHTGVGNLVPLLILMAVVLIVLGLALVSLRYTTRYDDTPFHDGGDDDDPWHGGRIA
jgi:hypothetical protein